MGDLRRWQFVTACVTRRFQSYLITRGTKALCWRRSNASPLTERDTSILESICRFCISHVMDYLTVWSSVTMCLCRGASFSNCCSPFNGELITQFRLHCPHAMG